MEEEIGIRPSFAGRSAAQQGGKREDNPYSPKATPDKHARWDNAFVAEHVRMQREREAMLKDPVGWLDYVIGTSSDPHYSIFVTIHVLTAIRKVIRDLQEGKKDVSTPAEGTSDGLRGEESSDHRGEREDLASEGEGDDPVEGGDLSSLPAEADGGAEGL